MYYVITIGVLYLKSTYKNTYTFVPHIDQAHHFWDLETAHNIAEQFGGRVIKVMEIEKNE